MRYRDYLLGQPVDFPASSRLAPEQVAARLKPLVKSRLWPFHFEQVVGRVGAEKVSIEWRGSPFGHNMSPRLTGRLLAAGGGTRFQGRFGAPRSTLFFLGAWTVFDATFLCLVLLNGLQSHDGTTPWFTVPFLMVHWLSPFAITAIGMVGADAIRQRLVDFMANMGGERLAQTRR